MKKTTLLFVSVLTIAPGLSLSLLGAPEQPAELVAHETPDGVLFQCYAPRAERVFLAGPFNNWAKNDGGVITDNRYAMEGPDQHAIFRQRVKLEPGVHAYKFCIDGKPGGWFAPSNARHIDHGGNALVIVDGVFSNQPAAALPRPPYREDGETVIELQDRDAHIVFLAGTFNNWANNDEGRVHDHRFVMSGPDADGIWRARLRLPRGSYRYQFVINGTNWVSNPLASSRPSDKHSVLEVR